MENAAPQHVSLTHFGLSISRKERSYSPFRGNESRVKKRNTQERTKMELRNKFYQLGLYYIFASLFLQSILHNGVLFAKLQKRNFFFGFISSAELAFFR